MTAMQAALAGFSLSLSLIVAIGAQNAFLLRQGLKREHVLPLVLTCAASDALLIAAGVAGFSGLAEALPWAIPVFRWAGAAFLIAYGARSFYAAWKGGAHLDAASGGGSSLAKAMLTLLAITWLNPHVYLDTVMLLGSISTGYAPHEVAFGIGGATASFAFFAALGFGARLLAPVFARPVAWRVLDLGIGLVMWAIALGLMLGA